MKAGLLNGQVKGNVGQAKPGPSGEKSVGTATVDNDRMTRLHHLAQKMGGPLNVGIGGHGISSGARDGQGDDTQSQSHLLASPTTRDIASTTTG